MNENRPCKKELLEWINIVSFAVDDVKLACAGLKGICKILWTSNTGYCKYTYGLLEMDQ